MPKFRMSRFRENKKTKGSPIERILIVCDGKNTEPSYFKKLIRYADNKKLTFDEPFGEGTNTCSTIDLGKRKYYESKKEGDVINEVWCVFDADPKIQDDNQFRDFCSAFAQITTKSNKPSWLHGVYSYESFEYWLLLHLRDHDGSHIERADHEGLLNKNLPNGIEYKKEKNGDTGGGEISDEFWNEFIKNDSINKAIERAKKIDMQNGGWDPQKCKEKDLGSSSNVYKLAERILGK